MKIIIIFYAFLLFYLVKCDCENNQFQPCIPKCCKKNEVFVDRTCKSLKVPHNVSDYVSTILKRFQMMPGKMCTNAAMISDFVINPNGSLYQNETEDYLTTEQYCLEMHYEKPSDTKPEVYALWCYQNEEIMPDNPVAMSIGNFFA